MNFIHASNQKNVKKAILSITYNQLIEGMRVAETEDDYKLLARKFAEISYFQNSKDMEIRCEEIAFQIKKERESIYDKVLFEILDNMVDCPVGNFITYEPVCLQFQDDNHLLKRINDCENLEELEELVENHNLENITVCLEPKKRFINKEFKISKFQVTQRLYYIITGKDPSFFKGQPYCPVEFVNWYEAKDFCEILNNLFADKLPIGYKFDLPSETQWIYACQAGKSNVKYVDKPVPLKEFFIIKKKYGRTYRRSNHIDKIAWSYLNSNEKTHEVGSKWKNEWGIYDMLGNVDEWCQDFISRGHSWFDDLYKISFDDFSSTSPQYPETKLNTTGFRLALLPIETNY